MRSTHPGLVVVMGVAGSGKSTLARALADRLGRTFLEADDFHSSSNVDRMRGGIPLTDDDRLPWLLAIRDRIRHEILGGRAVVLACSALKESHRAILSDHGARSEFVLLDPDEDTLRRRLEDRVGHFAGTALLPSQLAALERPRAALVVAGDPPLEQALSFVEAHLSGSDPGAVATTRTPLPRSRTETR